jgi:predicted O-methyltransferase YrrM
MDAAGWTEIDGLIETGLVAEDAALREAVADAQRSGLPAHQVSAAQGKLLHLLARMCGARRVLEIGTLAGYSTVWLARAVPPGGEVVTLELDERHAEVARRTFERTGVASVVELRLGPAAETLAQLAAESRGPFDLVFVDADKPSNPVYVEWALRLSRPGTVIVIDNVVRSGVGAIADLLGGDPRLDATVVQTVGVKGHDGFALAVVQEPVTTSA